ncbi:MAG: GIY-YIG nuclease family protein [Bacteroidales bacterium]|nr:GIY-YIG nuclease family protein [Candidatus Latescibacterota bacterium]
MDKRKINWGEGHQFSIHPQDTNWNDIGGVYLFCAQSSPGNWTALYIGQTESLASRLPNHERWSEAFRFGATHIHVKVVTSESQRLALEESLLRKYKPPLNTQNI